MRVADKTALPLERGVIRKIIEIGESYSNTKTDEGYLKFSMSWFIQALNGPILSKFHTKIASLESQQADLVDFVKLVVELIKETDREVLFLIVIAIDFFKNVCEAYGLQKTIRFKDITNFLIDVT